MQNGRHLFMQLKPKGMHMKRLLIAALLVSMGTYANEAAKVQEPAEAKVEENGGHKDWPSLNELWNDTEHGQGLQQAIAGGTPELEILLGYEFADDKNNAGDPAHAVLTRTRLNYQTGEYKGFGGYVQAQYVGPINDHFAPESAGYDTVNDPENFRFHQAYLDYRGYDSHVRAGSQEILLDNQRFIGNVGWRFNAQSFNAASVANHSISNLTLYYGYADSINTISGTRNGARQYHLINGEYKLGENNKAAGFAYLQRNDNSATQEKLDTYGLRAWGKNDQFTHDAMVALQRRAYYGYLKANMDVDQVNLGIGGEYLSGGDNIRDRFQTLNGTAHKFNGWADVFAGGTGAGLTSGLVDFWGEASVMAGEKLKLQGVYHLFNSAFDTPATSFSGIYGHEIDALAKYPICKNFDVLAKFAYYMKGDDDSPTEDKTVLWLRGTLRF
jgi:hypothetical protein